MSSESGSSSFQRLFGGSAYRRSDRALTPQPWLACGDVALPNPDRIVKTVLAQQTTVDDKRRGKGGWGVLATHYASAEQLSLDPSCSLAAKPSSSGIRT